MKKIVLTLLLIISFNSVHAYSVKQGSTSGRLGEAMGKGFSDAIDAQMAYRRQLEYQRQLMLLKREQFLWEMEVIRNGG